MKILHVVGARPNFMKIAPVMRAFDAYDFVEQYLVHTGQHYDERLSKVFFSELGIPKPDIDLGVGSGSRQEQIKNIMSAFEPVVASEVPDLVLVVGDVNSTVACARVARNRDIKVAHVEAGLRSFDPDMPEEHNRVETDKLSNLLFVTEESGMKNLEAEGIAGESFFVGNVMIDTLVAAKEQFSSYPILSEVEVVAGGYAVSTFHRPSNVDSNDSLFSLKEILYAICSEIPVVLPLHPRTKGSLSRFGLLSEFQSIPGLRLIEPLGYCDFMSLVSKAKFVLTDSGGIQEETTFLGVPCITMRENTERPATLYYGTNVLVGLDRAKVFDAVQAVFEGRFKPSRVPPLWDGKAAARIAEIIVEKTANSS